jgi:tryptophan-rich sensory protein
VICCFTETAEQESQDMSRQTLIFASISASLVPIGILIVLALNPHASSGQGVQAILDRGRERPAMWIVPIVWMIVFAGLGAGLSRLMNKRKSKSAPGFEVKLK